MELSYPAAQERFTRKYKPFLDEIDKRSSLFDRIFTRTETLETRSETPENVRADSFIYFLGTGAYEDFREIILLAGNGLSGGALKIVRSLYEKTITAGRLAQHPEEAKAFAEYGAVQQHKLLDKVPLKVKQRVKNVDEIEKRYRDVKSRFTGRVCNKCGRGGLQHSWTGLDTYSLAKEVDEDLAGVYGSAFVLPTMVLHTTVIDLANRVQKQSGDLEYSPLASEQYEKTALTNSHMLLLYMARLQCRHFHLGLEEEINQAIGGQNILLSSGNY